MSVEDIVQAVQIYLGTASQREFVSILGSAALALISMTTAILTYLNNRVLTAQVTVTRDELMKKEIEVVRLNAVTEERHKNVKTN